MTTPDHDLDRALDAAAAAIDRATSLVICAGAGMGRDGGLPDYRGSGGMWRQYAPLDKVGLVPSELADARRFDDAPEVIWGYFAHCIALYGRTPPHEGYAILRRWAQALPGGAAVFTSNVDSHFERAGFDPARIVEYHGSLAHWQCAQPCTDGIWPAPACALPVDAETLRATGALPRCPHCATALARPNVLLFWDPAWLPHRMAAQLGRFDRAIEALAGTPAVIEIGAGGAIPSVRQMAEKISWRQRGRLIRINPAEPAVPPDEISIPLGGLDALREIDRRRAHSP